MNYKFKNILSVLLWLGSLTSCAENAILPIANETNRESFLSARNLVEQNLTLNPEDTKAQAGLAIIAQVDQRGALIQSGTNQAQARGKNEMEVNQAGRAGIDRLIIDTRENNTAFVSKTVKASELSQESINQVQANTGLTHLQQNADENFITYLSKTVGLNEAKESNAVAPKNNVYLSKTTQAAESAVQTAAPTSNNTTETTTAVNSNGCFTILWYTPSQPVKEYVLRYGFVKDQLDNTLTIELSNLTKKQDAKRGSFYEYQLLCGSLNRELFFTISAKNDFGSSQSSTVMTVQK
ncbi:MAG: hypothetical protein LBE20_03380 [Deltaproteobacteria bacterium]|jgi:hypothetical protein|nr:hypothetical protein [Deltaproteobacteria bacterium]